MIERPIKATAVFESKEQKTKSENGSGNQPSNSIQVLNNALNQSVSTRVGENFLVSLLGRVSYDYKGKYLSLIHISEPTRLLSISYAVFCLTKKKCVR